MVLATGGKRNRNFGKVKFLSVNKMNSTDKRLEKVETITIEWQTFKKALRRNYLESDHTMFEQNHTFVLRLFPPFEKEMKAEYFESEQGRHYNSDWDQKPYHIKPELILLEGTEQGTNPFHWVEWPTATTTKNNLTQEDIEEIGGIKEALKESREWFWAEMKRFLPETYELGKTDTLVPTKEVELNWVGLDED